MTAPEPTESEITQAYLENMRGIYDTMGIESGVTISKFNLEITHFASPYLKLTSKFAVDDSIGNLDSAGFNFNISNGKFISTDMVEISEYIDANIKLPMDDSANILTRLNLMSTEIGNGVGGISVGMETDADGPWLVLLISFHSKIEVNDMNKQIF